MNNQYKTSDFRELEAVLYHPEKEIVKHRRHTQEYEQKEKCHKTWQLWSTASIEWLFPPRGDNQSITERKITAIRHISTHTHTHTYTLAQCISVPKTDSFLESLLSGRARPLLHSVCYMLSSLIPCPALVVPGYGVISHSTESSKGDRNSAHSGPPMPSPGQGMWSTKITLYLTLALGAGCWSEVAVFPAQAMPSAPISLLFGGGLHCLLLLSSPIPIAFLPADAPLMNLMCALPWMSVLIKCDLALPVSRVSKLRQWCCAMNIFLLLALPLPPKLLFSSM